MLTPDFNRDVRRSVLEELAGDPSLDSRDISVAVDGDVVALSGFVKSFAQKISAERAVKRATGKHAVSEALVIELPLFHRRDDIDIADAALDALNYNAIIVAHSVSVAVKSGWITLTGTVESHYERATARLAVASLAGVRGVSNEITVRQDIFTRAPLTDVSDARRLEV